MRGLILAAGAGTRLKPLTEITNKNLLPVAGIPIIEYGIKNLRDADIHDIGIVIDPVNAGPLIKFLGSGSRYEVNITYIVQEVPKGIAHAIWTARDFISHHPVTVLLGDNLFTQFPTGFVGGCTKDCQHNHIFVVRTKEPERFGIINKERTAIVEKPKEFINDEAVIGLYVFPSGVCDLFTQIEASPRGEYEVTSLIQKYLDTGKVSVHEVEGLWVDTGTIQSYNHANRVFYNI